jgi:hypothetical protein
LHHLSFNQLQELGYSTVCLTELRLGVRYGLDAPRVALKILVSVVRFRPGPPRTSNT